jgi:predicted nucleic acid binding AN1-type Zn finger protein
MPKQVCAYPECKNKINQVEMVMGKCRCENIYCIKHRLPEKHHCNFVYKIDKDEFIKENKCVAPKVII